jgi:hypothetical protein
MRGAPGWVSGAGGTGIKRDLLRFEQFKAVA